MIKLSVLIITFNEEANIGRCLDSVQQIADEIVIVDSFSTDSTVELCKAKGVKVVQHPFENFVKQRNIANAEAKYNHVFSLDADEVLSEELITAIIELKKDWKHDAYEINRLNNYCGKWIKHSGWYPEWRARIFDRSKGKWDGIFVHEKLKLQNNTSIGKIDGHLLHYSYNSISEHIQRINKYTDLTAEEAFIKGKRSNGFKIWFNPKVRFVRDFIFNRGFLDGYYGYIICRVSAVATFLKYSKLKDKYLQDKLRKLNK